ncbi:MAG TPA: carbohydrate porin, partial [Allocoleopsis sp.]
GTEGDQPGTTTHLEVLYRYRISDNITLTPGFIVLFNPGNTPESDTVGIGALRTTFTF